MNRRAIAMAADSASTITRWVRGERKRRFFKGSNKIFHLSKTEPVGMMVYGAGSLQGVPWEVLAKTFRDESLKGHWHKNLSGYSDRFFKWLQTNKDAFPEKFLEEQFLSEVIESAGRVLHPAIIAAQDVDKSERRNTIVNIFEKTVKEVYNNTYLGNASGDDIKNALVKFSDKIHQSFNESHFIATFCGIVGEDKLRDAAVSAIFKEDFTTLDESGIVFGGFGRSEYFPSVESYHCYGSVLGKLIISREEKNCETISQKNQAAIMPFAKNDMIWTFMAGTSISGLVQIGNENQQTLNEFEDALRTAGHLAADVVTDTEKDTAHEKFKERVTGYFRENHSTKLQEVVGMLPVEELAELSETLVSIESLKERVTTEEESVSGPIDVAIISRNDGFIWIKRKHYFERELNPRYFSNIRGK